MPARLTVAFGAPRSAPVHRGRVTTSVWVMEVKEALVDRALDLAREGRVLLGICGSPGAGKSTFAKQLVEQFGGAAVVLPMDGFHLHDDELALLGRQDRKGAPDTFDVGGYVSLLRRIREHPEQTVYAPAFDRERELAVAGAIAVRPEHRLVVTEGNYLLHDAAGWHDVRPLLDETWFVDVEETLRVTRLVRRHVEHGRSPEAARAWVLSSDQANAELVESTRNEADLVVLVD